MAGIEKMVVEIRKVKEDFTEFYVVKDGRNIRVAFTVIGSNYFLDFKKKSPIRTLLKRTYDSRWDEVGIAEFFNVDSRVISKYISDSLYNKISSRTIDPLYIYRIDVGILSDVGDKLTKTKVIAALKYIKEELDKI